MEAVKKANESAQVAGLKDSELFRLDKVRGINLSNAWRTSL